MAFISLSHSKVLKLFMPVTAPSFLPLLKVILIKNEPYFPTTARPQALPLLKTARTQRVQFESKGTFFPSQCQQTLLLPRATLLPASCFGTLLSPHISRHTPVQPQHAAPELPHHLPGTSTTPDGTTPRFPPPRCPARAPSDCLPGCPACCQPGAGMRNASRGTCLQAGTESELLPRPRARSPPEINKLLRQIKILSQ